MELGTLEGLTTIVGKLITYYLVDLGRAALITFFLGLGFSLGGSFGISLTSVTGSTGCVISINCWEAVSCGMSR